MRRACRYLPVNTDTRPTQPNAPNEAAAASPAASTPVTRDDPSLEMALSTDDPPVDAVFGTLGIWPKGDPKPDDPTFAAIRSSPATGRRKEKLATLRNGRRRRRPPLAVTDPPASHPVRAQPHLERVTRRVLQHGHGDGSRRRRIRSIRPTRRLIPPRRRGACTASGARPRTPTRQPP